MRSKLVDTLTDALAWLARRLSHRVAKRIADLLGWVWCYLLPIRRLTAESNLALALSQDSGQTRETVLAMYRHLALCVLEMFRYGTPHGETVPLRIEGQCHLDRAVAQGQGVLVVTAHLGNWELLLRYGSGLAQPVQIVTKTLSVGFVQRIWTRLRMGGTGLLSADGAASSMITALRQGEIIGMVLDQHAPENSAIPMDFFGVPASTSTGLVRAARMLNTPIVPMFTWRDGTTHVISIGEPLALKWTENRKADVSRGVRQCLVAVEDAVRAHPAQWLWIHRRWKLGKQ